MIARAMWRSEAFRVVPWLRPCACDKKSDESDQNLTLEYYDVSQSVSGI